MGKKDDKTISDKYVKLSQIEHVLLRPDTYIGSVSTDTKTLFVANSEDVSNIKFEYKNIGYNSGFIKIFDEAITNASDYSIESGKVTYIKVNINGDIVTVENDGPGIPIIMHDKEKIYIPELIFGHLLTGTNYNDEEDRYVSGRNGLGIKCLNIYSKLFTLETADGKKHYKQEFKNNLSVIGKPVIKKSNKNFVKVTYKPDFERFGMTSIDADTKSIMIKRIFDIAAYNPTVKVYYNDKLIPIKTYKDYIKLFTTDESTIFHEKLNENWEVAIIKSPTDSFNHVSMVNGTSTYVGGTHVNHVSNGLVTTIKEQLERGVKGLNIRQNDIKNRILLFVNCRLPNPTFDTQTKENLTLKLNAALTKDVKISDALIKKISKSDIYTDLVELSLMKERLEAQKELNKQVSKRIRIDKLVDANNAGKLGKSQGCYLMLSEGDSAKNMCIAGFSVTGRDNFGVFPLKGKPMNVHGVSLSKVKENEELKNLIQILGLEMGKTYKDTSSLRYGKVVFTTDSDNDGLHIKGLLLEFFELFFPSLLRLPNNQHFIYEFVTPIMIATMGKKKKMFYKKNEYDKWVISTDNSSSYTIKYFKGLGTIGPVLGKELFKDLDKHLIPFHCTNSDKIHDVIDLAFNKKRADDRKEWLSEYKLNKNVLFDKFSQKTTYESFMLNEFIEFSMEDNVRSIPSVVDGLKPSQRKIIYTLLKMNSKNEMNVGELFGYVKSSAQYHHGNMSLEQGIITLAQDYMGSNNLSLLEPLGSFGTRLSGGKDSAAPRYIYTRLREITKDIFMKNDSEILNYLNVDGYVVEPDYYLPIIPHILLNGTEGIGTGWSTSIPKFKMEHIIEYIENKLNGKKNNITLTPFYEKFTGEIIYDKPNDNYITKGTLQKVNSTTITITELPIGVSNDNYYIFLEDKMIDTKLIISYEKNCTDEKVNIKIKMRKELLDTLSDDELYKMFKLDTNLSMSNMHLFDPSGKIKKYSNQYEIIDDYYAIRLDGYNRRKEYLLNKLRVKKVWFDNMIKFMKLIMKNEIKVSNVPVAKIIEALQSNGIIEIDGSYQYILNIPIYKMTKEELQKLKDDYIELKNKLKEIEETSIEKMWKDDLSVLKSALKKYNK